MVGFVPRGVERVLDVGCGDGLFASRLKEREPGIEIIGIDPVCGTDVPFNERITGRYPEDLPPGDRFDCVVFNDVLEHNLDPGTILRKTIRLLRPRSTVIASIPNVRHFGVVYPLVGRGRFDYRDKGILDRTHVRFFTRATMRELFEENGYVVTEQAPINVIVKGKRGLLNRISGQRLMEFVAQQYVIVARLA
jgi:2-polyprenyl-3-methyl-5-hydroxy-6-metoxy-1,4-benzoquinol methylase